jgi:uncharacterized paraquat-inducible protein A
MVPKLRDCGVRSYVRHDPDVFGTAADYRTIIVSLWLVVRLSAATPVCRSRAWLRRTTARRALHSCPSCSYDLTGNVSGVCPECGTKVRKLDVEGAQRRCSATSGGE